MVASPPATLLALGFAPVSTCGLCTRLRNGRRFAARVGSWWALYPVFLGRTSRQGVAKRLLTLRPVRPILASLRDPWDRLIVATAIELGVPLITADGAITALSESGVVEVVW
jgi:hypothetical protein